MTATILVAETAQQLIDWFLSQPPEVFAFLGGVLFGAFLECKLVNRAVNAWGRSRLPGGSNHTHDHDND